jgi:hypothetical protein
VIAEKKRRHLHGVVHSADGITEHLQAAGDKGNERYEISDKNYAEGIYVLNSEGAIEILNFWYEEFDCDDTGTYLYIKTCCNPDPVYFDILVEGPFETEPEFVSKELVPGECEYLITFWWEFGTVACADATLTAVVKDYCGNSDEKELVIENIRDSQMKM